MNICGVVITLNEEKCLRACIESLNQVCSQVIVVDSFSTDQTVTIAENEGAEVHQMAWEGYAATKNKANDLANAEFILSLDADEVLSEELIRSIKNVNLSDGQAFTMNRRNRFRGQWMYHTGWYPDKKLRLFPKNKARWVGDFVHETLELNSDVQTVHLRGDLLHFSADDVNQFYQRNKKYTVLRVREAIQNGQRITWLGSFASAVAELFKRLILKRGVLDGWRGLQLSWIHAKLKMARYTHYRAISKGIELD